MTSVITYGILGLLSIGIAAIISVILIMCGIIYANIKRSEVDIGIVITALVVLFSILVYILTNLLIHIYHNGFNYSFTF